MKEAVINLWCDRHYRTAGDYVKADVTRRVAIDGLAARTLDLCDTCDKEVVSPLIVLLDDLGTLVELKPPGMSTIQKCQLCEREMSRHSLLTHVRAVHLDGPPRSLVGPCEVCGMHLKSQQAAITHLSRRHDFDVLTDLFAQAQAAAR